jgi:hypothetical protein
VESTTKHSLSDSLSIVRDWGCIPAAIIRIATKLRNELQTLAEFKRYQALHRSEMLREGISNLTSIAAMWALEDRSPPEKSLLNLLCFLHHDRIPEKLLKSHWEKARLSDTLDGSDFRSCWQKLQHDRLIESRDENDYGKATESLVSIEKVLQDGIQAIFLRHRDRFSSAFNAATSLLSSAWPNAITAEVHFSSLDEESRWKECRKLIPHIERVVEKYMAADDEIQTLCATSDLASLLIEASWYESP